jgi:uncharacterized protein
MKFDWDEDKNRINLVKHGLTFEDVIPVFNDLDAIIDLDRDETSEERWRIIGVGYAALLSFVVYAHRDSHGVEMIRIISARRASRQERKRYEQAKNRDL